MKIKYGIKEFSEDPRTLKDGDWFTLTEKHSSFKQCKGTAWRFHSWIKGPNILQVYYGNSTSAFGARNLSEIIKIRKDHPDYTLKLNH